ncbi:MATE family efflux transporter [Oscillospiraceae bacterium OttesenSCG-928-F05]|nr:MATE family efflux transporter [Oscillospiraceae bacterium OttesenSCG-928-F05]
MFGKKQRRDAAPKKSHVQDMTEGRPLGLILRFALPLMLGNAFQQCYTLADTIIVGQGVGVQALAAVGAAGWFSWLILGIITGFTQGFSIFAAQTFGAKDYRELNRVVQTSAVLTAGIVVLLVAAAQLLSAPMLRLMQTPEDIMGGALIYLRITFWGIPLSALYNLSAAMLTALGDSKGPLKAMVIASAINIGLDMLFVFVFHWGIAGAAGATVIAQGFAGVYCALRLRAVEQIKPEKAFWRPEREFSLRLLKTGLPVSFQNSIISTGGMVVQSVVNTYGLIFIAGYTATNRLYGLLEIAAISFGYAVMTFVGQNIGAKKPERVRKGVSQGAILAVGVSLVIAAAMLIFGRAIAGLFVSGTPEEVAATVDVAYSYLTVMSSFLPLLYILHNYRNALLGLGDTVMPMVSGIAEFAMRVLIAMTLPALFGGEAVFFAETAAWAAAALILFAAYRVRIRRFEARVREEALLGRF